MPQRDLTYLLLPGSDGRSGTWSRVAALLRACGDRVETLDGWDQTDPRNPAGLLVHVDPLLPDALAHLLGDLRSVDA